MAKPSESLLSSLTEKSSPKPQAEITVTVESEPDYETLGAALRSAIKGSDNRALCHAIAAICECCGYEGEEIDD